MSTPIKLSDNIVAEAKIISKVLNRSIEDQIEHWAKIGKIAEENPDLNYELIKEILVAQEEAKTGRLEEYKLERYR